MKVTEKKSSSPVRLALAAIAVAGSLSLVAYQYFHTAIGLPGQPSGPVVHTPRESNFHETDDGRQLLWARGPREIETGEWFDVTGSPLEPDGYQYGIGKDSIPAIDQPTFVAIDERDKLREHGIDDETVVIGYAHNEEAKAYPIAILNHHELVNDMIGGKPVTVGW